mgnify:CR=1 FL=1
MARSDFKYINIPIEQADALERIYKTAGKKHGYTNRNEMVKAIFSRFIEKYEETHDLVAARDSIRLDKKRDAMKPLSIIL